MRLTIEKRNRRIAAKARGTMIGRKHERNRRQIKAWVGFDKRGRECVFILHATKGIRIRNIETIIQ